MEKMLRQQSLFKPQEGQEGEELKENKETGVKKQLTGVGKAGTAQKNKDDKLVKELEKPMSV